MSSMAWRDCVPLFAGDRTDSSRSFAISLKTSVVVATTASFLVVGAATACASSVKTRSRIRMDSGYCRLVPVMLRLVRAVHGHADVVRLILRELRQLHAEMIEVQARHLLV